MSSKESLLQSLVKSGWHLTPESIDEFLAENPKLTTNELVKKILNCDLRSIGAKYLTDEQFQGKTERFDANLVLQLVKLRNIAAPKENETCNTAPRMFKITLTDGTVHCNALVLNDIPKLNLNTPPGTKIYLNGVIKVKCNLLMLDSRNTDVLGGEVDYMVTKWKANKDLYNHVRTFCQTDNPPPPWVPFGTKQKIVVDTSKKVFAQNEQKEEVDSTSGFSQARQAALAEALEAKSKVVKTFTQIEKPQIDSNPAPRSMLAAASEPAPRAMRSADDSSQKPDRKGKKGRKGRRGDRSDEEEYADAKGAAKPKEVTLFDVFKKKLDIDDAELEEASGEPPVPVQPEREMRYNNRGRGRGGRYQGGRGRNEESSQQAVAKKPQKEFNLADFNYDLSGEMAKVNLKESTKSKETTSSSSSVNPSRVTTAQAQSSNQQQQGQQGSRSGQGRNFGEDRQTNRGGGGGNRNYEGGNRNYEGGNRNYERGNRNNEGGNRNYEGRNQQPRSYENRQNNNQYQPQQQQFQQSFQPPPPQPQSQPQYYYPNYNQNPNMYYGQPGQMVAPPYGQYDQQYQPGYDYGNQYGNQQRQQGPPPSQQQQQQQNYQPQQHRNTYYNSRGGGGAGRGGHSNRGSNY